MLFVGIYIDPNVIRVSRVHPNARDPNGRLDARRRENYGLERWYSRYQGSLPNIIAQDGTALGYDVLEEELGSGYGRLDESYFKSLLNGDTCCGGAVAWQALLREVRQNYVCAMEPACAGIYMDGVDLAVGPKPLLPWRAQATCKAEVEQALLCAGEPVGFVRVVVVDAAPALQSLVRMHPTLRPQDLLVDIGYDRLAIWLIVDPGAGAPELVAKGAGIKVLIQDRFIGKTQGGNDGRTQLADLLGQPLIQSTNLPLSVINWRAENILRSCRNAIAQVGGRGKVPRLHVAGEGAGLFDEHWPEQLGVAVSRLPDAQFLSSFAAAARCYEVFADVREHLHGK
jgi:hypothetical protein